MNAKQGYHWFTVYVGESIHAYRFYHAVPNALCDTVGQRVAQRYSAYNRVFLSGDA
jgi:cupin superfamily acireductone dioxygenase involved in methionine salvage